ncbi:MAG: DUF167 domain-containing protein [Candidatus Pacearchaeota archaeon]|nr:DUF167 domain-containing protein [Candidatus Pacearchaeota archaeon]
MIIKIKVHPNAGRQEIVKDDEGYAVYLKSVPEDNKANIELIKMLKKHFGKDARIKSGFTSRKKLVEVK